MIHLFFVVVPDVGCVEHNLGAATRINKFLINITMKLEPIYVCRSQLRNEPSRIKNKNIYICIYTYTYMYIYIYIYIYI